MFWCECGNAKRMDCGAVAFVRAIFGIIFFVSGVHVHHHRVNLYAFIIALFAGFPIYL